MYAIGSYAVPQIQSVNPDINIDSFHVPGKRQGRRQRAELWCRLAVLCDERNQE